MCIRCSPAGYVGQGRGRGRAWRPETGQRPSSMHQEGRGIGRWRRGERQPTRVWRGWMACARSSLCTTATGASPTTTQLAPLWQPACLERICSAYVQSVKHILSRQAGCHKGASCRRCSSRLWHLAFRRHLAAAEEFLRAVRATQLTGGDSRPRHKAHDRLQALLVSVRVRSQERCVASHLI